jgi:hypothetical protein
MLAILHCPKCGRENKTQSSYCEFCLTEQPSQDMAKVLMCPECHAENEYANDHCYVCHEPLKPGQTGD